MHEGYDYLVQKTKEYTNQMLNSIFSVPNNTTSQFGIITFTNQTLTKGILQDGTQVNVIPRGRPNPVRDIGVKVGPNTYLVYRKAPHMVFNDGHKKTAGFILCGFKAQTGMYLFNLAGGTDLNAYFWINNPSGLHPGTVNLSHYTLFDITPDGNNLIYLDVQQQADFSLNYTAATYKGISVGFDSGNNPVVKWSNLYTVSGNTGNPIGAPNGGSSLGNIIWYSYVNKAGHVCIDFVTTNNPSQFGPQSGTADVMTFIQGVCPETSTGGSVFTNSFDNLFNNSINVVSGNWQSTQILRTVGNNTAGNLQTESQAFTNPVFDNAEWSLTPLTTQPATYSTDSSPVVTDSVILNLYTQIHTTQDSFRTYYPYTDAKAVDSLLFYNRRMTGLSGSNWNFELDLLSYNTVTSSFSTSKKVTGTIPPLFQFDNNGVLNSSSNYIPIAFAIQNGVSNVNV